MSGFKIESSKRSKIFLKYFFPWLYLLVGQVAWPYELRFKIYSKMRSTSFANSNWNVKAFKLMEYDNINNCRTEHDFSIK